LRFSTPSALAGHARVSVRCPEAPSSLDDSRFDVRATPARASDHGPAGRRSPLRVCAHQRTRRDEARVAGVRAGRWNRIRRSRCFPPRPALRRAAGDSLRDMATARRSRCPSRRTSATAAASGATGESGSARAPAVRPLERLRYPSARSSLSRVIRLIASFFRVAFRYPCDRSVTWPGDAGLPSFVARRRSWGSFPSQV
jgi:hypothetical protein